MDAVLNSNSSSSLVSVLSSTSNVVNPFVYKYGNNLKNHSMGSMSITWQEVQSSQSLNFSSNLHFNIPKAGYVLGAFLKVTLTKDSGDSVNNSLGALFFDEITLQSQGKVLHTQTKESLLCAVAQQPYEARKAMESMLGLASGSDGTLTYAGSTTAMVFYVPLVFSCFEDLAKVYNSDFTEPIQIIARSSAGNAYSATDIDGTTANTLAFTACSLWIKYARLNSKDEQDEIQQNYSNGEALTRVQWNWVEESSDVTLVASTTTEVEHEIKHNQVIQEVHIVVLSTNAGVDDIVDDAGCGIQLDDITITANGQNLFYRMPTKLLGNVMNKSHDEFSMSDSSYWDQSSRADGTIYRYVIPMGLSLDSRRFTGGASARELSNLKCVVRTANATSDQTAARLYVICKCAQLESIAGESGRIQTSISS